MKLILVFLFSLLLVSSLKAEEATPLAASQAIDAIGQKLEATKLDVDKFKNAWDKVRLEVTLYEKRRDRAYQRWVKSTKVTRAKAQEARDKAELELALSVERRKLAFSQWQAAIYRQTEQENQLKALSQDQDTRDIQKKIQELQAKLGLSVTPVLTPHA